MSVPCPLWPWQVAHACTRASIESSVLNLGSAASSASEHNGAISAAAHSASGTMGRHARNLASIIGRRFRSPITRLRVVASGQRFGVYGRPLSSTQISCGVLRCLLGSRQTISKTLTFRLSQLRLRAIEDSPVANPRFLHTTVCIFQLQRHHRMHAAAPADSPARCLTETHRRYRFQAHEQGLLMREEPSWIRPSLRYTVLITKPPMPQTESPRGDSLPPSVPLQKAREGVSAHGRAEKVTLRAVAFMLAQELLLLKGLHALRHHGE